MKSQELVWRIAGGSGDGINSTSHNFAKSLMRSGLNIFSHRHYPSRIRGGHTYVEIRAKDSTVRSRGNGYNFLLALGDSFARNPQENAYYGNEEIKPVTENLDDLREDGIIVYDDGLIDRDELPQSFETAVSEKNLNVYPINLREIAKENGREVMRNTAGVGATAALVGLDLGGIKSVMESNMSGDILQSNIDVLESAYDKANEFEFTHSWKIEEGEHDKEQALVSGSHGVAFGAIDSGCQFISGYPMTPWTDVFQLMTKYLSKTGGVSEQVEDEIAAICLAIGASHSGAKAMSGSSGGGFSLMSEALGMAEMTETPLVLVEAQRGGPSTGLPTKPEQSDLEHVLYSSHGDSNRIVFAPDNVTQAYEQTRLAFSMAYNYQLPSVILIDQKISGELRSVPASFFDNEVDSSLGSVATEDYLENALHHESGKFARFNSEEIVSKRSLPGQSGGRFLATGNEHNQYGHISEDPDNRERQMSNRLEKVEEIRRELRDNYELQTVEGETPSKVGIVTFGSQAGTVFEAAESLNSDGIDVSAMSISQLKPFPKADVENYIKAVDECFVVEMNASGQLESLIKQNVEIDWAKIHSVRKFNGNPFVPEEITTSVKSKTGDKQ